MRPARHQPPRHSILNAILIFTSVAATCTGMVARADSSKQLQVLTDTSITQSLVSMVMGDTGQPEVLMRGSASPHSYSLRPSDAQHLGSADVLFWTSRNLTPWLVHVLDHSHARTMPAEAVELMTTPGTVTYTFRLSHVFADTHENDVHEINNENTPDHDAEHASDHNTENSEQNGREQSAQDHGEHDTTLIDPHGWLDPVNAANWVGIIAAKLGEIDPDNAQTYNKNAIAARLQINELQQSISEELANVPQRQFVVFHDSFQYFETRFNLFASAAIALGDANIPGIRQMNELREEFKLHKDACLFSEPQFSDKLMQSLSRGLNRPIGSLDPLGATQTPGPDLYNNVMTQIADALRDC